MQWSSGRLARSGSRTDVKAALAVQNGEFGHIQRSPRSRYATRQLDRRWLIRVAEKLQSGSCPQHAFVGISVSVCLLKFSKHVPAASHQFAVSYTYRLTALLSLLSVQAGKSIAVAGAGLGGLAFALALLKFCKEHQVHPLPHIHIFERDSTPDARAGFGYSLGVRSDSGGLQVHQIRIELCDR